MMAYSKDPYMRDLEVRAKLASLDRWRPRIALAFIIFWILWSLAVIGAIVHYFF